MMKHVRLTMTFTVTGNFDAEGLDVHTDLVMDELMKLESDIITDSDITASLADAIVSVTTVAAAESFEEATDIAQSTIRTAIHAAGGSTPQWAAPVFAPTASAAELVIA
jgi:hypothetical protein